VAQAHACGSRPGYDVTEVEDVLELRDHHVEGGRLPVELDAYGYLWLRARKV